MTAESPMSKQGKPVKHDDEPTAGREIVITRLLDAPRELVWDAWTDPQKVVQWWGPRGFTTTHEVMDLRAGGVWKRTMHGPDGKDYPNKSVFIEVVKPERLVYSHGGGTKGEVGATFIATITFEAVGSKTRLTMRSVFPTPAVREHVVKVYRAVEGGNQTLDRLEEHLGSSVKPGLLVKTRILDASREAVFAAWTEPARLQRWWGPVGFTNPVCQFDLKPGGAIRIDMRAPDGTVYPMTGRVVEFVKPTKLVFEAAALNAAREPVLEVMNTLTIEDYGGRTKLTLHARVTRAAGDGEGYAAGMDDGWKQSLERLAGELVKREPDSKEFTLTREIAAPRERVWKAWTEASHLTAWWGPRGCKIRIVKLELEPGGVFHYAMGFPDGSEVYGRFTYLEIVKPERLVWVNSFSDEQGNVAPHPMAPGWPLEMRTSVTFTEAGGKTILSLRSVAQNASETERKTFEDGFASMTAGFNGTFDQLVAHLTKA
jgi:uncharacterized protein YndB with AHSA1/START domain